MKVLVAVSLRLLPACGVDDMYEPTGSPGPLDTATRTALDPELGSTTLHEFDAAKLATLTGVAVEVPIAPVSIGDTTVVRGSTDFPAL